MGYYSSLNGDLSIDPPLTAREFRDDKIASYVNPDDNYKSVKIEIEEERRVVDDGVLLVRTGVAIVPSSDESRKHYDLESQLADLAEAIHALPGTHEVIGWMVREGEEQGDVERHTIKDGKLVTEKATLRWPDGSDVNP